MDRQQACDRIDLIGLAAAAELCSHADDGACPECAVSTVTALWSAIDTVGAPVWPAALSTDAEAHEASPAG